MFFSGDMEESSSPVNLNSYSGMCVLGEQQVILVA